MPTPRLLSLTRAKRLLFKDWDGEYQRSADLVPQADEIDDYPRLERTLGQIDALTRSLAAHAGAAQVAQAAAEGGAAAAPMQLGAPPASEADERAAARVLAREGFDSDRLRRDVRGLELQTTFEDVFPVEVRPARNQGTRHVAATAAARAHRAHMARAHRPSARGECRSKPANLHAACSDAMRFF